jgi:hypothetical protein
MASAAPPRLIEVLPADGGWAVELGGVRVCTLDDQPEAVAYACHLSDELSADGPPPRIRVYFRKDWRLKGRASTIGSPETAVTAISGLKRND